MTLFERIEAAIEAAPLNPHMDSDYESEGEVAEASVMRDMEQEVVSTDWVECQWLGL